MVGGASRSGGVSIHSSTATVEQRQGTMTDLGLLKRASERDDGLKTFVWNPETRQFLGRTGGSWCKYSKKHL